MAFVTVTYLVALSLPVYLVAEQVNSWRRAVIGESSPMIEFDVKCLSCKKLITLRVRDAQAQVFFEEKGALCEDCYKRGPQPAPSRCAA